MFAKIVLPLTLFSLGALAMDPTIARGLTKAKFSYSSLDADSFFDYEQHPDPLFYSNRTAEYSEDRLELELTYGWTEDIAVILRSAQEDRELANTGGQKVDHKGFSGHYLGLRQRIANSQDSQVYSEIGVRTGAEDQVPLPLSAGGTDWFLLGGYNQQFLPSRAGFEMDFGYVFAGDEKDYIQFDTKLHLDFLRLVMIDLDYHVLESTKDSKDIYTPLEWPKERGYQQGGVTLSADLTERWSVDVGYQKRFKGRNQFETDGFKVELSWIFGRPR